MKAATPFGGGIGEEREICGALSGALMAIGLRSGRTRPEESRQASYRSARALLQSFRERFSTLSCAKLTEGFADFHGKERRRYCAGEILPFVASAADRLLTDAP